MIDIIVCDNCLKLTNYERLNINENENYDVHYSEIIVKYDEINEVIKLLQDYKNAA